MTTNTTCTDDNVTKFVKGAFKRRTKHKVILLGAMLKNRHLFSAGASMSGDDIYNKVFLPEFEELGIINELGACNKSNFIAGGNWHTTKDNDPFHRVGRDWVVKDEFDKPHIWDFISVEYPKYVEAATYLQRSNAQTMEDRAEDQLRNAAALSQYMNTGNLRGKDGGVDGFYNSSNAAFQQKNVPVQVKGYIVDADLIDSYINNESIFVKSGAGCLICKGISIDGMNYLKSLLMGYDIKIDKTYTYPYDFIDDKYIEGEPNILIWWNKK